MKPTQSIIEVLRREFDKNDRKRSMYQLLFPLSVAFFWLTALVLIEVQQYLSVTAKTSLIAIAIIVSVLLYLRIRKIAGSQSFTDFYRDFGTTSDVKELNYAIDLTNQSNGNHALVEAAIKKNLEQAASHDLKQKLGVYSSALPVSTRFRQALVMMSLGFLSLTLTGATFQDSTSRLTRFWAHFDKPNPFIFEVLPGNQVIEQGSSFTASIAFTGSELPKTVSLGIKTTVEEQFRFFNVTQNGNTFTSLPVEINANTQYYLQMDEFGSQVYNVNVQLRPRFEELTATAIPPSYTGLDSLTYRYPFSELRPYQGSVVKLRASINKEIDSLHISTTNNADAEIEVTDNRALYSEFVAIEADTFAFELIDRTGLTNSNPFQFNVNPILDEYPVAEIIEPRRSIEDVAPETLTLQYRVNDDFGVTDTRLKFEFKKAFVEDIQTGSIPLTSTSLGTTYAFEWDLTTFNLTPKDELTFWVEVTDNDEINEFKSSQSQVLSITIPSVVEYFEELDAREDTVQTGLEDILEAFDEAAQQYEEFKEELKENPESAWQKKDAVEDIKEEQKAIEEKLDELNEAFEEITKELQQNNLLSEETQQAYEELKKLLEEIDDPALREALEELQQSLDSFSPDQLREALENVEFNEQAYKERLDRTLELFKRLQLSSDLEKIARSAEDISQQQENADPNDQNQQESLNEQLDKLKDQIDELSENPPEQSQEKVEEFQEQAKKDIEESKEAQKEQNQVPPQNGEQQQQGDSSSEKTQKVADDARSLASALNQQQQQINVAALRYILYSLINISDEQEDLTRQAQASESRSQIFVTYARSQNNLDQVFKVIADSLFEVSKSVPAFSNEINKKRLEVQRNLDLALTQLSERNAPRASEATQTALGGINEIAFEIANLLENMQSSGGNGNGNPQESLQQSIEQQQQLSEQLQQIANDLAGDRLGQDDSDRLNQIAEQQKEIRRQIQELQRNGSLEQGDQLGSELERIIEELEESINDLRGGVVDPLSIERQQNILSRMLNADKALQERGEEEKREGTTGENLATPIPTTITLEELEKEIRNRLKDPNFTKYSPDYQKLIEKYFELLKKLKPEGIQ